MSEETPPPTKPKVSSLRDRIAAFEQKPATTGPPPLAPRPKPGHVQWKPRAVSPPPVASDSKPEASNTTPERKYVRGGMSASDAKESIGLGGSLKERMAALQGKGAFGAPAPAAPPPRPLSEKPKWKPPPVIHVPVEEGEASSEGAAQEGEDTKSPTVDISQEQPEGDKQAEHGAEAEDIAEPDAEEEERQRRAAIAARMARLGGARLGMAPPVFGVKPQVKKVETPKEEQKSPILKVGEDEEQGASRAKPVPTRSASTLSTRSLRSEGESAIATPPSEVITTTQVEPLVSDEPTESTSHPTKIELPNAPSQTSLLSESGSASSARSPPTSMPVPAGPRRAGPPRKKPVKTPSASSLDVPKGVEATESPSTLAVAQEDTKPASPESGLADIGEQMLRDDAATPVEESDYPPQRDEEKLDKETLSSRESVTATPVNPEASGLDGDKEADATTTTRHSSEHDQEVLEEQATHAEAEDQPDAVHESVEDVAKVSGNEPEAEDDEDEVTRRKRIADRIAKAGGLNPLAAAMLPRRQSSSSSEFATSPLSARSEDPGPPPPIPGRNPSVRKASGDSALEASPTTHRQGLDPQLPPHVTRKSSAASSHSISAAEIQSKEARYHTAEINEEPEDIIEEQDDEDVMEDSDIVHFTSNTSHTLHARGPSEEDDPEVIDDNVHDRQTEEALDTRGKHEALVETVEDDVIDNVEATPEDDDYDYELPAESSKQSSAGHDLVDSIGTSLSERPHTATGDVLDDDDEMAPPRIRRPLPPPPPPEPAVDDTGGEGSANQADVGDGDGSRASSPIPVPPPLPPLLTRPIKRQSVPPPPRAPPVLPPNIPSETSDEYSHAATISRPPRRDMPAPPPPALIPETEESIDYHETDDDEVVHDQENGTGIESEHDGRNGDTRPPSPPALPIATKPKAVAERSPLRSLPGSVHEDDSRFPPMSFFPPPPPLPAKRPSRATSLTANRKQVEREELDQLIMQHESPQIYKEPEEEIIDEEDGDPIDPSFHSPLPAPKTSLPTPPQTASSARAPSPPLATKPSGASERTPSPPVVRRSTTPPSGDENGAAIKRRTIAERMARLGGIKFGAPLQVPIRPPRSPLTESASEDLETREEGVEPEHALQSPQDEEEDETARKERISAKLAGIGGMRLGMLPTFRAPKSPAQSKFPSEEMAASQKVASPPPPPPPRLAVPPPPPGPPAPVAAPAQAVYMQESGSQSTTDSDLVEVEAEQSDEEDLYHEEVEEEAPPPIPTRSDRRPVPERQMSASKFVEDLPPPVPGRHSRPPIPVPRSPPVEPAHNHDVESARKASVGTVNRPVSPPIQPSSSGEYELVDEPEEAPPPPPPRLVGLGSPGRTSTSAPPPPPVTSRARKESQPLTPGGEWGLPNIPDSSLDFVADEDLSASHLSEDSTSYPQSHPPRTHGDRSKALPTPSLHPVAEVSLSGDELLALWGRVGVHVGEAASTLHEKSRKMLVGDGTYPGFVNAALSQVPNAAVPSRVTKHHYGHLIYSQTASTVNKRLAEIMPGDIITIQDATFKGHKGLRQNYQQIVGLNGEPVVGIIGEFENKKSKAKVYEANQHVGAQTVESVSYRLEDLKSGNVMVFRVSDA